MSAAEEARARLALERLIAGEGLAMAAQPIVDLSTDSIHAYEALARFGRRRSDCSPLSWFALADELGERVALERACLKATLDLFGKRPRGTRLSVNLSVPEPARRTDLRPARRAGDSLRDDLEGLIIEITEETLVSSDREVGDAIEALRERGARLAVDDIGAGYSGLRQITTVLPDYLKLDRSLIAGIHRDGDRGALVSALSGYASQVGSLLVAEGIEQRAELDRLRELDVPLAQGFYLGVPGAPWPVTPSGTMPVPSGAHLVRAQRRALCAQSASARKRQRQSHRRARGPDPAAVALGGRPHDRQAEARARASRSRPRRARSARRPPPRCRARSPRPRR